VITHADGSRGGGGRGFYLRLSVCQYVFPHHIWKIDAAKLKITKLDTEMFHDESWKSIYFRVKCQRHESQKNIAGVGLWAFVSASFS